MQPAETEQGPTDAEIETAIVTGLPWLRFPAALEAAFELDTGARRSRELFRRGVVALAIFLLFVAPDWQVVPDVFGAALIIRLGIVLPLSVAMLAVIWHNPPVWVREGIEVVSTVMAGASSLVVMLLSQAPLRQVELHGVILVILYATMVQRIRFYYAAAGSLCVALLYFAALAALPEYPAAARLTDGLVFGSAVVLSLMATYALERETRRNYLVSLRERLLNVQLAALSRQDALTGLANRRSLDEILGAMEIGRTQPLELGMLLFDIDHFKLYNDGAGHLAGDVCLKRIAGIIRSELRERADMAFRFGGEEFLVLLPDVDLAGAVAIGERIRHAIEGAGIPHPGQPGGRHVVTISAGAAAAVLGNGLSAAEIIAGADAALYAAKRNGRNQVWPGPHPWGSEPVVIDTLKARAAKRPPAKP
jgi:diguanylate cyclase (GGDEF)-like protein